MKIKLVACAAIFLLTIIGVYFFYFTNEFSSSKRIERVLGKKAVSILSSPDFVYFENDPTKTASSKQARILSSLLLADSSYIFDWKKKSLFFPEAKVRFKKGEELLVEFCFSSKQVMFRTNQKLVVLDVDPIESELRGVFE